MVGGFDGNQKDIHLGFTTGLSYRSHCGYWIDNLGIFLYLVYKISFPIVNDFSVVLHWAQLISVVKLLFDYREMY